MAKTSAERVIAQARKWIGYLEKKSNSKLDDYTANAGKNNYTRFNRDYKAAMNSGTLNMQWCASFVSCMFMYEFGFEAAKKLLCKTLHCYTPSGASYFKSAGRYTKRGKGTPEPGDVVFFYSKSKGRIGHVGIVTKVSGGKVYTIEGNTSGANKLITNGGGVCEKSYALTSTYIDGYGKPPYAEVDVIPDGEAPSPYELGGRLLKKGSAGEDVRELQSILIRWNYELGKYGADGEFGNDTYHAVANFQRTHSLEDDGIYGPKTHAKLMELLAREVELPVAEGDGEEDETEPQEPDGDEQVGDPEDDNDEDEELEPSGDEDPAKDPDKYVVVTGNTVNVRTQPNTSGKVVFVAKKNDQLAYSGMSSNDGWHCVVVNGVLAWISGKYSQIEAVDTGDNDTGNDPPIVDDGRAIIDISVYQTITDVNLMKQHVKLCIHRASIGLKKDAKWDKHAKLMRDAGIAYGVYHYVKATTVAEAIKEAQVFYASASPWDPIFYCADMEWSGIAKGRARNICSAFIGELKRLGARKTGIYVGHHLYKLWNLNYDEVDFVWIPRYGTKKVNLAGEHGANEPAYVCTLHQYSSCGKIPGVKVRVDMNHIMTGKKAQLSFEELVARE